MKSGFAGRGHGAGGVTLGAGGAKEHGLGGVRGTGHADANTTGLVKGSFKVAGGPIEIPDK